MKCLELTIRSVANTSWCSFHQQTEERNRVDHQSKCFIALWSTDNKHDSLTETFREIRVHETRGVYTWKAVLKGGSSYLATLTILGLYCLRSCNRVFIVFPVSIISLKCSKREAHISGLGIESSPHYYRQKTAVHTSTIKTFCEERKEQLF